MPNRTSDFSIKHNGKQLLHLEGDLDNFSKRSYLILINSDKYSTPLYFAHRHGWVNSNEMIASPEYLNDKIQKGLKYIIILKKSFGHEIDLNFPVVFENGDYKVHKVDAKIYFTNQFL